MKISLPAKTSNQLPVRPSVGLTLSLPRVNHSTNFASRCRCNADHSGNRRLTFSVGYYECNGCGTHYTRTQIEDAKAAPRTIDNRAGVVCLPE